MTLVGDLALILDAAQQAGVPFPSSLTDAAIEFIKSTDPNGPLTKNDLTNRLLPDLQREKAMAFTAALRVWSGNFAGVSTIRDVPANGEVVGLPKDLILSLADLPAGYTQTGEEDCAAAGSLPACFQRTFDHPRFSLLVSVSKFLTVGDAKSFLATVRSSPQYVGARPVSLGGQLGDESYAYEADLPTNRSLLTYTIWFRRASVVNLVFFGGVRGTFDIQPALDIAKAQLTREPLK